MSIKESTIKAYEQRIKTLAKRLHITGNPLENVSEWITIEGFDEALKDIKIVSRHSYVLAVIHYLDRESQLYEDFTKVRKEIRGVISREQDKNRFVKTDKDRERWVTREQLDKRYRSVLKQFEYNPYRDWFILLFYLYPFHDVEFGVLRNDLATLQVGSGVNVVDLDKKLIVLNDHKNSRIKGAEVIEIPDELFGIIKRWIDVKGLGDGDFLVDITRNNITIVLKKYLGLSTTLLRKINQTEVHGETYKGMEGAEKTAKLQGHTMKVVKEHYIKTE